MIGWNRASVLALSLVGAFISRCSSSIELPGGAGGIAGEGGVAGQGGMGGMAGMGGSGGCPAGASTPLMVNLLVDTGFTDSFQLPADGLQLMPGADSGLLAGSNIVGVGTNTIGSSFSIEDIGTSGASANESVVFEVFRSEGTTLVIAEGATDVVLLVNGPSSSAFTLSAEDKYGASLGSAMTMVGSRVIDVSSLLPGEIPRLTTEATGGATVITGLDYTHLCLGYTP